MRRTLILCCLTFLSIQCSGLIQRSGSDLIVISTVHNATPKFSQQALVQVLDSLQPDIILLEYDPSFFDSSGMLLPQYREVSLEGRAALEYSKTRTAILMPYDVRGRNAFYKRTNYFAQESAMNRSVDSLWHAGLLPAFAMRAYDTLVQLAHLRDSLATGTIAALNTALTDSLMIEKARLGVREMRRIVDSSSYLERYPSFASLADSFWVARNSSMITNIREAASKNPGKRIVVFSGFEHAMRTRLGLLPVIR
jgi:hypothetical protein